MPTLESIYDLEIYLSYKIRRAMDKVIEEVKDLLIKNYYLDWYHRGHIPRYYDRTFQLIKGLEILPTLTYKSSGISLIISSVSFTGKNINPVIALPRKFNSYMSLDRNVMHNGVLITEAIAYWMEYGVKRNPFYAIPKVAVFSKTKKSLKVRDIERRLAELLRSNGLDVTIR